jgi:hypothetical protein
MTSDDPSELPGPGNTAVVPDAVTTTDRPRRARLIALITLVVLGLAGALGGGFALHRELTRGATKAEVAAALATEIGSRWERLPAGTIFPATISYPGAAGNTTTATLVGIAPITTCRAALEPAALAQIRSAGCTTMLRATYVSAGGAIAATVGIGVLPSAAAAEKAEGELALQPGTGLYTLPYAGTITSSFTGAARGAAGVQFAGPYLFLYTAGYTDGQPGSTIVAGDTGELGALGTGILSVLEKTMTSHGKPCSMRDISC